MFAEFHRTLAPGGHLIPAGHVGHGEHPHPTRAYGAHPVSYESHLLSAERIAELLEQAGPAVTARLVQEPEEGMRWRVGTILARKQR